MALVFMRSVRFTLLLLLLGPGLSGSVFAHADLLEISPANGSSLASSPAGFVVRFSEPVTVIRVQLLNRQKQTMVLGEIENTDGVLRFSPTQALPEGQYLLSVRVLSLDAHPVSISVGLSIGNLPPPLPEFTEADRPTLVLARITRSLNLISVLASIGLFMYPFLFGMVKGLEARRQYYLNLCAFTGILTALIGLGLWGVLLSETTLTGILEGASWALAMDSSLGTRCALMVAGLSGMLMANFLGPELPPGRFSGLLGVLLVVACFGASGHAAGAGLYMGPVFVIHAFMAGLWFGALWLLYPAVLAEPAAGLTTVLTRFSKCAGAIVCILLGCAVILGWYQLGGIVQLVSSDYGNWLLIKAGLVCLVLILAAMNRWHYVPAIVSGIQTGRQALSRSIYIEGILICIVLSVTAILTSTAPPARTAEINSRSITLTAGEGIDLGLTVSPASPGNNRIEMLFKKNQRAITPMEVDLYWQQEDAGIEPLSVPAIRLEDGRYLVENVDLFTEGTWQFRIDALIDDFTRERFQTDIIIQE